LPNDIVLFVTIDKFDPNLILVNKFIENRNLQRVLINLSDLVADEHVQIEKPKPLLVENANFEHVKFEPVNNYLTHGSIIRIDVLVHYYDDEPIVFNYVFICNDQNDTFSEKPIDVCILEVYNLKSHIQFWPQSCYHLK
jgi:hypothetical protein